MKERQRCLFEENGEFVHARGIISQQELPRHLTNHKAEAFEILRYEVRGRNDIEQGGGWEYNGSGDELKGSRSPRLAALFHSRDGLVLVLLL